MPVDINTWNDRIIAEFRANAGRVAWSDDEDLARGRPVPPRLPGFAADAGAPIILVHHTGARTGRARINPLVYQRVGNGFAIFATVGGHPSQPAWYHNLIANPATTIEVGTERLPVTASMAEGGERDRVWARQVATMPRFADFAATAGRHIPIFILYPR